MPAGNKQVDQDVVDQDVAEAVKVGDQVKLDGSGLAVLPDGSVVTCRNVYTVQHAGRHTIGGLEYDATDPRKAEAPADPVDPED
jgi:hypothetical protein